MKRITVKTVRFSNVVEKAGKPEIVTLWTEPKKDKRIQRAIKESKFMTVHQPVGETKTAFGEVGFNPGGANTYLVFTKSLKKFEGCRIVGIKWDLIQ